MGIERRGFLGAAGLGMVVATVGPSRGQDNYEGNYAERVRPSVAVGIGKGEAASMSFVWLPRPGREQSPPIKARLVMFDIGGKAVSEEEVLVAPFSGASLVYEPPKGMNRQLVFGYVFFEYVGEIVGEVFAGMEVFDASSGRTNIAFAPVGVA